MAFPLLWLLGAASVATGVAIAALADDEKPVKSDKVNRPIPKTGKDMTGDDIVAITKRNLEALKSNNTHVQFQSPESNTVAELKDKTVRMQNILKDIRIASGLTTQALGDMLALTRQAISNLENKSSKLTVAQYLAISSLIQQRAVANPCNATIIPAIILGALVETPEKFTDEERNELRSDLKKIIQLQEAARSIKSVDDFEAEFKKEMEAKLDEKTALLSKKLTNLFSKKFGPQ